MLANVWNKSGRQIIVEIEQVLSQIIQRNALGHVIRILVEIAKPHFLVLPISESNRRHPQRFYRYCSSGQLHDARRSSRNTAPNFSFRFFPLDELFLSVFVLPTLMSGSTPQQSRLRKSEGTVAVTYCRKSFACDFQLAVRYIVPWARLCLPP